MKHFVELEAWKAAHRLRLSVYRLSKSFPREEQFGLTSQIRRAAGSVCHNIAEGFGRFTPKEFHHFCNIAAGSLAETEDQLILAHALAYITTEDFEETSREVSQARAPLRGLMSHLRTKAGI